LEGVPFGLVSFEAFVDELEGLFEVSFGAEALHGEFALGVGFEDPVEGGGEGSRFEVGEGGVAHVDEDEIIVGVFAGNPMIASKPSGAINKGLPCEVSGAFFCFKELF